MADLVAGTGGELLGRHHPQPRFPLLFKFLDASKMLSVQVHPDDAGAAKLEPPDLGKTEAWVILAAEPGSLLYVGLKPGIDRWTLEREIARGACDMCLHRFEPKVGDCVFVPAGVVHTIGAGLLVAEIQQSSDATLRLFDWNRIGADGKPRPLHIAAALDAIDYDYGPGGPQTPKATDRPHVSRLVQCSKFVLDRWDFARPEVAGGDGRCHIISVLSGSLSVERDPTGQPLTAGGTVVLPASMGPVVLSPQGRAVVLDSYLP
jgi:mannose-6-phosphate isomerase